MKVMPLDMKNKIRWTSQCASVAMLIALCALLLAPSGLAQAQTATSAVIIESRSVPHLV